MLRRSTPLAILILVLIFAALAPGRAADNPTAPPTTAGATAPGATAAQTTSPVTMGPIPLSAQRLSLPPPAPSTSVSQSERSQLERSRWPHDVVLHQWSPTQEVPPEVIISQAFLRTRDERAATLSLKEAIYLALRNNPGIQAARLDPLGSLEAVRETNAVFDPDLTAKIDVIKSVTPTTSFLTTGGASQFSFKQYDWNFGVAKVLSTTNGTLAVTFNNNRQLQNSAFASINPSYNPALTLSLAQPLLRNFGLDFATINVRIAELNQKATQFSYEQNLSDFILKVASDYWTVVRAEENLEVAREAYKLAQDLVRQNEISVRVGVLAPLDVKEAQSEEATRAADVFAADNALAVSRAALKQDVMLNPEHRFIPQAIEPSDKPGETESVPTDEEQSLELAMQYRPELASMRQAIRSMLLQVRYAENQLLPQLNLGAQIGLSSTAGTTKCQALTFIGTFKSNCSTSIPNPTPPPAFLPGAKLPFGGIYGDALDRLWYFSFYNYAAVLSFEVPLDNDAAKAALAQTKIQYEQERLNYRNAISQVVVDVESALSSVLTGIKRVQATRVAVEFAQESLRAEQERFRVGMANTHELLQFQDSLVAALGNQVQAQIDLEIAKLGLKHAEGTLLRQFKVDFVVEDPRQKPWYSYF